MVPSALASDVCSLLVLSRFARASSWAFCSSLLSLDSDRCSAASWAWNSFRSSTWTGAETYYTRQKKKNHLFYFVLVLPRHLRPFPSQQVLCGQLVCPPHGLQLALVILLSLGQLGLVLLHQTDLILRQLLHPLHQSLHLHTEWEKWKENLFVVLQRASSSRLPECNRRFAATKPENIWGLPTVLFPLMLFKAYDKTRRDKKKNGMTCVKTKGLWSKLQPLLV